MYGKLENGILTYAPNGVEIDNTWYIPPTDDQLVELGYKPIEFTPQPEPKENYYFTSLWKETKTKIKQVWEEHYVEPQYSIEERLRIQEEALTEMAEMLAELSEVQNG